MVNDFVRGAGTTERPQRIKHRTKPLDELRTLDLP